MELRSAAASPHCQSLGRRALQDVFALSPQRQVLEPLPRGVHCGTLPRYRSAGFLGGAGPGRITTAPISYRSETEQRGRVTAAPASWAACGAGPCPPGPAAGMPPGCGASAAAPCRPAAPRSAGLQITNHVAASAKAMDLKPLLSGEEAQNGNSVHVVVCNCVRPDRFHLLVSFLKRAEQNCSWTLSFHTCETGMEGTRTCLDELADEDLGDAAHDDRHVQVDLLPHNRLLQLHRRAARKYRSQRLNDWGSCLKHRTTGVHV